MVIDPPSDLSLKVAEVYAVSLSVSGSCKGILYN
jgi:hypothetical protein